MDRKAYTIVTLCIIAMVAWMFFVNKRWPGTRGASGTNTVATATSTNQTTTGTNAAIAAAPVIASAAQVKPIVTTNTPEELIVVTNEVARYTFTSHGGGVKIVELFKFPETVTGRRQQTNKLATLNESAAAPIGAILDGEAVQGDGVFNLTKLPTGVRAEKELENGLKLVKDFQLGSNYFVDVKVRLENTSTQSLALPQQEWVIGTATPMGPKDDGQAVGLLWFNGDKTININAGWFANKTLGCFPGTPRAVYQEGQSNVVWASVQNQYFTITAIPAKPAHQLISRKIDLPRFETDESPANGKTPLAPVGFQTALIYPAMTLAPGQAFDQDIGMFAGPKEFRTLTKSSDKHELERVMGFGWFGSVAKVLLRTMNWMHDRLSLSYGWAIVLITILIKLIFWPLTAASTRSMKRMQALQPQMKVIQTKYKDDPMKMNKKMMEFYKENKVNPMGGCLPMLIQIPVFFGFFTMIRTAIELRGAPFLWVSDLSQPDTLFMIPGINFPFNLLPLLMGVTMLWQARITPLSPGMDPAQQQIMKYMPLMMLVFLYNFSAGLTLYWTVQNLLTIAQMKLTKTKPLEPVPAKAAPVGPFKKKK